MSLRASDKSNGNSGNDDRDVSDYDGKPLNTHSGVVDGRRVTVYSSWRRGDPDR